MSTSFRPRPIDVHKSIPIFREYELDEKDVQSARLPQMATGMEAEEEEEAHIQEAIKRSLASLNAECEEDKVEIPTPTVRVVPGWDEEDVKPFVRPQSYIKHKDKAPDEVQELIEYDMDHIDEEFLATLNAGGKNLLPEAKFELMIDRLEKECERLDQHIPHVDQLERILGSRNSITQAVYAYWVNRRKHSKMPLLYRFLRPPDPEDPSPYHAFRPRTDPDKFKRKGRKNDQSSLGRMKQLRLEMERARTLFEMIKKRERLKRDMMEAAIEMFDTQLLDVRHHIETNAEYKDEDDEEEEEEVYVAPKKQRRGRQRRDHYMDVDEEDILEEHYDHSESEASQASDDSSEESPSDIEESPPVSPAIHKSRTPAPPPVPAVYTPVDLSIVPPDQPPKFVRTFKFGNQAVRGRARLGRGGRLVFDRIPQAKTNGIIYEFQSDADCCERTNSLSVLWGSSYPDLAISCDNPDGLLKQLQANQKRNLVS